MRTLEIILSVALLGGASVALADNKSDTSSESTDAAGTSIKKDRSHKDTTGMTGTRTIEDDSKTVTDPGGLLFFFKDTATTEKKYQKNGDMSDETTTVDAAG